MDIAKGIGILCIIAGHLNIDLIVRIVSIWHVPIFFLVGGFFLDTKSNYCDYVRKRTRRLIWPYCLGCLLIMLFSFIINIVFQNYENVPAITINWIKAAFYGAGIAVERPLQVGAIGAIWFFLAMYWGCLIVRFVLDHFQGYARTIAIGLVAYVGWKTAGVSTWPLSIQEGMFSSLFIYLGVITGQEKQISRPTGALRWVAILAATVIVLWEFKYFNGVGYVSVYFGNGLIDLISSICGCYLVLELSEFLTSTSWICSILAFWGKHSGEVLVAHIVELNTFPWWIWMEQMSGMGIPMWIVWCLLYLFKLMWAMSYTAVYLLIMRRINYSGSRNRSA